MTDLPASVRRACLTECTARKPGNVHPGAGFDDLTYGHFVAAAEIVAETLPAAATVGVGPAVLECVRRTVRECGTNVNLGIALLLAPLCRAPAGCPVGEGVAAVLAATTVDDAAAVYEAIRLADPGGLGSVRKHDVRAPPTVPLHEAMRLAADRDDIARTWADGFSKLWCDVVGLEHTLRNCPATHDAVWEDAVLLTFLGRLASRPDTHIARRCGNAVAEAVRREVESARETHRAGDGPLAERPWVRRLDASLRGHRPRRNPGTTADLTCAALFWAAREGRIDLPDEAALAAHAARLVRGGGGG